MRRGAETPAQRHARLALGRPLREVVAELRALGHSWQSITKLLHEQTGGEVDLSDESLRRWYGDLPEPKPEPEAATA